MRYHPFIGLFVCYAALAQGQVKDKFDRNGDGFLDPAERKVRSIHLASPVHQKYDKDLNGILSPAEAAAWQADLNKEAAVNEFTYVRIHPTEPKASVAEVEKLFPSGKLEAVTQFDRMLGIQVRRSLKDVDPNWELTLNNPAEYGKALSKVPGATFSYERNLVSKADSWTALGVIARPFVFKDEGSTAFIPSIEFDRFQHRGDAGKERDVLIFRTGFDIGLPAIPYGTREQPYTQTDGKGIATTGTTPVKVYAGNRLRLNLAYKTNSGLETETLAGEAEWETSLFGMGGFQPVESLHLAYCPRIFPRLEFGTRTDGRETLTEDEKDFFRYGPVLSLRVAPYFRNDWDSRLLATVEYMYLLSAKADHGVKNFVARLDWNIDQRGHLKLAVEYRNGALTLEDRGVETLTVGLGVAF